MEIIFLDVGQGDALIVSRVPWISYNWGPYGVGANVLYAPGRQEEGWAYTEDGLRACVDHAARDGRKVAGLVITCPDNPTGLTITAQRQVELAKVAVRLDEHEIKLDATPAALELLAELGYDPEMGARPLRRVIQQKVEDPLSDALLAGEFVDGDSILVDAEEDEIILHRKEDKPEPAEALAAT